VFLSLRGGTPPPLELYRTIFCEKFGWTFEEFGLMDMTDMYDTIQVWDGIEKAQPKRPEPEEE
jgi:hypothetical protein